MRHGSQQFSGLPGVELEVELRCEATERVTGWISLLAPLGLGFEHQLVRVLESALLRSGFHGAGRTLPVEVPRERSSGR